MLNLAPGSIILEQNDDSICCPKRRRIKTKALNLEN